MRMVIKDNIEDVVRDLQDKSQQVHENVAITMWRAMSILEVAIKQNLRVRSGLRVRTGTLLNSVQKHVKIEGPLIYGTIGPENVKYAAIHEFGGTIPARRIEPRHAKALKWMNASGKVFFSKGHNIPATRIPARPYLRPAWEEKSAYIRENFKLMLGRIMETK